MPTAASCTTSPEQEPTLHTMALLTPEPVLLVEHCDGGRFKPHSDGLDALRRITAAGTKVVCVAGPYRQGKSYLANKLMGQQSGFGVGHTTEGKTRGVWMWAVDRSDSGEALVVLDTEGLDDPCHPDSGATLNAKLFTMAVLLSSELLLNTTRTVNNSQLDQLSFITELIDSIKTGHDVESSEHVEALAKQFPSLRWVVRDHALKIERDGLAVTPDEMLEGILQESQGVDSGCSSRAWTRRVIRSAFPRRKCATLSRPGRGKVTQQMDGQSPAWEREHLSGEFLAGLDRLVAAVRAETRCKIGDIDGSMVTLSGEQLAVWTEQIVSCVNEDVVDLPHAIASVIEVGAQQCTDAAVALYVENFHGKLLLPVEEQQLHDIWARACEQAQEQVAAHTLKRVRKDAADRFATYAARDFGEMQHYNFGASVDQCKAELAPLEEKLRQRVREAMFADLAGYDAAQTQTEALFRSSPKTVGPGLEQVICAFRRRRKEDASVIEVQTRQCQLDQDVDEVAKAEEHLAERVEQDQVTATQLSAQQRGSLAGLELELQSRTEQQALLAVTMQPKIGGGFGSDAIPQLTRALASHDRAEQEARQELATCLGKERALAQEPKTPPRDGRGAATSSSQFSGAVSPVASPGLSMGGGGSMGGTDALKLIRTDKFRGEQFGTSVEGQQITNASHIVGWDFVKHAIPQTTVEQCTAITKMLNKTPANLPIKSRHENAVVDKTVDTAIIDAAFRGGPLITSEEGRARVDQQIAVLCGTGKAHGVSDENVKSMLTSLVRAKGITDDSIEKYPVVFKDGKPFNLWTDKSAQETGLRKDGEPDGRTKLGEERIKQGETMRKNTGMTNDGRADDRTKIGRTLGAPKKYEAAARTGLRLDGKPDGRTKLGREMAAKANTAKAEGKLQKVLATKKQAAAALGSATSAKKGNDRRVSENRISGLNMNGGPDHRFTGNRTAGFNRNGRPDNRLTGNRTAGFNMDGGPDHRCTGNRTFGFNMDGSRDGRCK